jgi:phage-related protein
MGEDHRSQEAILPARRTAAWKETAWRMPMAKKTIASVCGEAAYLRVKR